jgi:hypothetical protein
VQSWGRGLEQLEPLHPADEVALGRLALEVPDTAPLLAAIDARPVPLADHYSTYNLRHSWRAVALRGFSDDPAFIQKPAEMSKGWKAEHPEALAWTPRWTPLLELWPEAVPLIEAVPGHPERVRLMHLRASDGELTRHADIIDPDAGTAPGRLCRIHLPLRTSSSVVFTSWRLDGTARTESMAVGSAYYLDTRKPHAAVNTGSVDRLHLVIDTSSTPQLRRLIAGAA